MATTRSKTSILKSNLSPTSTLFEYPPSPDELEPGRSVISFTKHDFKQLQPCKYLNDTIIYFFMQYYLDHHVAEEIKRNIHVFNSFFFSKIRSIHSKKESEPSYEFASRWLKNVDIFEKDFLIIPVCEKDHWVLVIVCYLDKPPQRETNLLQDKDLYAPTVIVLNSCRGLAPPVKKSLSQFLTKQWLQERGSQRRFTIHSAKKSGLRLIFPDLPQQKNSYDCGVYILGYFYCFLKNPRQSYISMFRGKSMRNWFIYNNLDISRERRKMLTFVRNRVTEWQEKTNGGLMKVDANGRQAQPEVHLITSKSDDDDSSIDCIEERKAVEVVKQIDAPSPNSRAKSKVARQTLPEDAETANSARNRRGTIVIN